MTKQPTPDDKVIATLTEMRRSGFVGNAIEWRKQADAVESAINSLKLLKEYEEMMEVATQIRCFVPSVPGGVWGQRVDISISPRDIEYHVTDHFPGKAESVIDAWGKAKREIAATQEVNDNE